MAAITIPEGIVLYNDGATNHIIRPQWNATKVAQQTYAVKGQLTFVYDPFTETCWLIGRSGQLIHDGRELSPAGYRAIWAEKNF
jgi:hypothetical protein